MPTRPQTRRLDAVQRHKREAIVEAAMRVFAEAGVEGASVRAIAARAGYTPGALYTYFADKEALASACLARSLGRLLAALRRAGGPAAAGDALSACARAFRDYYRANPAEFALLIGQRRGGRSDDRRTAAGGRLVNGRLIALLAWIESLSPAVAGESAGAETVLTFAQLCGLVLAEDAGWLEMLGFDAQALIERAVNR